MKCPYSFEGLDGFFSWPDIFFVVAFEVNDGVYLI
jgi:hypothetical protein